MTVDLGSCSFHTDISASTSCSRCHRLLCPEDRKNFNFNMGSGVEEQDFCPICYVSALKDLFKFVWFSLLLSLLFLPLSIYFFLVDNVVLAVFFGLFSLLGLAYTILSYVQRGPEYSRVKKEVNIFLNLFDNKSILFTSSNGIPEPPYIDQEARFTVNDAKHLICFECGSDLSKSPRYCPNCSGRTTNEFVGRKKYRKGYI